MKVYLFKQSLLEFANRCPYYIAVSMFETNIEGDSSEKHFVGDLLNEIYQDGYMKETGNYIVFDENGNEKQEKGYIINIQGKEFWENGGYVELDRQKEQEKKQAETDKELERQSLQSTIDSNKHQVLINRINIGLGILAILASTFATLFTIFYNID